MAQPDVLETPESFRDPDRLAELVLDARARFPAEAPAFGNISADGVRALVCIAYYGSQAANEGRFPRLTLFVPAPRQEVQGIIRLDAELSVAELRRLGPALASQECGLVVAEHGPALKITGIVSVRSVLSEIHVSHASARPASRPAGLSVDICAPGELLVVEHRAFRLLAGVLRQELSFFFADWFQSWYREVAAQLFDWSPTEQVNEPGSSSRPDYVVARTWYRLLRQARDLRHGGCFVVLEDPARAPIWHTFRAHDCDLGAMLAFALRAIRGNAEMEAGGPALPADFGTLMLVRERLLSAVDTIAHLSAADGCVVFNRRLQLHSFASMIELSEPASDMVPCFQGDTDIPIDVVTLRSLGARRRSAALLCEACPGAMAFVISQDGELRIFVRCQEGVRLYENAAYW